MVRKKLAVIGAAALLSAVPLVAATASSASAMTRSDYTMVCQQNYGGGWVATLDYPSQGAFGWRCRVPGLAVTKGLKIWSFCNAIGYGGAYTNNTGDPYSWYCA